jgi:Bacterial archaeo-eukaryotic release factor family 10
MMERDGSLRALEALEHRRFPQLAISAYLPTDAGGGHFYYRALLEDLARPLLPGLSPGEARAMARERARVETALEKHRFGSPAVAVFSSAPSRFLRLWRLSESTAGRLTLAERLDLAPLRRQLLERPPSLAAVVDKREVRLFAVALDELRELGQLEGLPINHHRQGGWSAASYQRREDEHARWNLGQVARSLERLLLRGGYRRLILAGPPEARAQLRALLSAPARRLLVAEGTAPVHAGWNDLARRLRTLDERSRRPAVAG